MGFFRFAILDIIVKIAIAFISKVGNKIRKPGLIFAIMCMTDGREGTEEAIMDGVELSAVITELNEMVAETLVSRVNQPFADTLVLSLYRRASQRGLETHNPRLLLSVNPRFPRMHLTRADYPNPPKPPTFCQLLRSRLEGKRLGRILQPRLERIAWIPFFSTRVQRPELLKRPDAGRDAFRGTDPDAGLDTGCRETLNPYCWLVVELMGKHSNIVLLDGDKRIIDAVKRIPQSLSRVRQVLPGLKYVSPPGQDKLDMHTMSRREFESRVLGEAAVSSLVQAIVRSVEGVGPGLARDIARAAGLDGDRPLRADKALTPSLWETLEQVRGSLSRAHFRPVLIEAPDGTKRASVFAFLLPNDTHTERTVSKFDTVNSLIDAFYTELHEHERLESERSRLKKVVSDASDRVSSRLTKLQEEMRASEEADKYKTYGDILLCHMARVPPKAEFVELTDWATVDEARSPNEEGEPYEAAPVRKLRIPLDPRLTPAENAQRYFKMYKRLKSARSHIEREIRRSLSELEYLNRVDSMIEISAEPADLEAVKAELVMMGHLHERKVKDRRERVGKTRAAPRTPAGEPLHFRSSEGIDILVGRNNVQNDQLSLRTSDPEDTWFHVKGEAGAHVVLKTSQTKGGPRSLMEAAMVAAYYSKLRASSNVPVDYTLVKYVRKQRGAKPGLVTYDHYSTLFVTPRQEFVESLRVR